MPELICPFTRLPVTSFTPLRDNQTFEQSFAKCEVKTSDSYYITYTIDRNAFREWEKDPWFTRNRHLVEIAYRKNLGLFTSSDLITLAMVKQRVGSSSIPHTPKMKLDNLLRFINEEIPSPGKELIIQGLDGQNGEAEWRKLLDATYSKDQDEVDFYFQALKNQGLIAYKRYASEIQTAVTYSGLLYLASLETEGHLSKNCFVAMSFDASRQPFREAIERAVRASGYDPVMIDTQHIDSDKTINDRIIAEIRACKFCISDFTGQRNGVYFEAGFALGLGKAIIYICENEDFIKNSHFDLKPFQHILYHTEQELETQLVAKIAAWIQ